MKIGMAGRLLVHMCAKNSGGFYSAEEKEIPPPAPKKIVSGRIF
jgi:hypothetical protein